MNGFVLPTLQRNALRILLNKPDFRPEEVAAIKYQVLARSPRLGKKGLENIRLWLEQYGLTVAESPEPQASPHQIRQRRRVEKAIEVIRKSGLVVRIVDPAIDGCPEERVL